MNLVGVVYNPKVPEARPLADQICDWLQTQQLDAWMSSINHASQTNDRLEKLCLMIVLGGDGTTLQAARLTAPHRVPIFGINMGRVGFLAEAAPDAWQEKLDKVLCGQHWLEHRLMLRADVSRNGSSLGQLAALNDVVVSRSAKVRVVRFHLHVDGDHVTSYTADALIAATPTGSTAYSMAAGGPLLPPQLQNFLVLPVAPHLSFERPLVLHKEAVIMIKVEMDFGALVTADGQDAILLQSGDEVIITKHNWNSIFARVGASSYFYHRLMQRLSYWSLKK